MRAYQYSKEYIKVTQLVSGCWSYETKQKSPAKGQWRLGEGESILSHSLRAACPCYWSTLKDAASFHEVIVASLIKAKSTSISITVMGTSRLSAAWLPPSRWASLGPADTGRCLACQTNEGVLDCLSNLCWTSGAPSCSNSARINLEAPFPANTTWSGPASPKPKLASRCVSRGSKHFRTRRAGVNLLTSNTPGTTQS